MWKWEPIFFITSLDSPLKIRKRYPKIFSRPATGGAAVENKFTPHLRGGVLLFPLE